MDEDTITCPACRQELTLVEDARELKKRNGEWVVDARSPQIYECYNCGRLWLIKEPTE